MMVMGCFFFSIYNAYICISYVYIYVTGVFLKRDLPEVFPFTKIHGSVLYSKHLMKVEGPTMQKSLLRWGNHEHLSQSVKIAFGIAKELLGAAKQSSLRPNTVG